MFSATIVNIEKALAIKTPIDLHTKLPKHFYEFLDVFNRTDAEKLPPLRGKGINYAIELEQ